MRLLRSVFYSVCCLALLLGCTQQEAARCTAPEDNPIHHYLSGMESLGQGKIDTARSKFDRAIYCDAKFAPGYAGLAIVTAEKAKAQADGDFKKVEAGRALEYLNKSEKFAESPEDRFDHDLAVIRVKSVLKPKDWLRAAEEASEDALSLKTDERKMPYYMGKEAAVYFLGIAYISAMEFPKARDRFSETLNTKRDGKWHAPADKAWRKADKIVRALSGITVGDVGKSIAVKDSITRGDLAALLVDELSIDKLFAGRIPSKTKLDSMKAEFTPADILTHHFKEETLTVMKWKVRGLEPRFDETTKAYLFKPAEAVNRGEMALILEDVLIKLTGDDKLATAYFGQTRSPFPDVRATSPLFNAVMNMTTRNIMEGELSGEFRAAEPVDGAEALLAIRMLRQSMNIR